VAPLSCYFTSRRVGCPGVIKHQKNALSHPKITPTPPQNHQSRTFFDFLGHFRSVNRRHFRPKHASVVTKCNHEKKIPTFFNTASTQPDPCYRGWVGLRRVRAPSISGASNHSENTCDHISLPKHTFHLQHVATKC